MKQEYLTESEKVNIDLIFNKDEHLNTEALVRIMVELYQMDIKPYQDKEIAEYIWAQAQVAIWDKRGHSSQAYSIYLMDKMKHFVVTIIYPWVYETYINFWEELDAEPIKWGEDYEVDFKYFIMFRAEEYCCTHKILKSFLSKNLED